MNTHFARTGGALVSTDVTPPFQPNVTKSRVTLKSDVEAEPDEAFKQEYERRRQMFYAANTTDTHQWKRVWYTVKGQKPTVHVHWVDHKDPWYATVSGRNCAALTPFTAVAWLKAINGSALRPRHRDRSCHRRDPARRLYGQAESYVQEDVQRVRGSSENTEEPPRHRCRPLAEFLLRPSTAAQRRGASLRHRVILPFDPTYRHVVTSLRRSSSVARPGARGRRCRGPRSPRGRRATTVGMGATASLSQPLGTGRASPATIRVPNFFRQSRAATGAGSTAPP